MRWKEARREQDDDERLKAAELLWRVAKATDNTVAVDVTVEPPQPLPLAAPPAAAPPAPARRSKRVAEAQAERQADAAAPAPAAEAEQQADAAAPAPAAEAERQADAAAPAPAAPRLDAVNAALEACRASRAVVAAKREDKKRLRDERDQREGDAKAARCQCPSLSSAAYNGSVVPQALTAKQRVDAMTAKQNERHQCPNVRGDRSLSFRVV